MPMALNYPTTVAMAFSMRTARHSSKKTLCPRPSLVLDFLA
jgi:hypothetical protein